MMRACVLFSLLFLTQLFATNLPDLMPEDVGEMLHQMMENHVSHKRLSPLLVQRTIKEFIAQLDPMRTYLLKEEVEAWLHLDEARLNTIIQSIEQLDFDPFFSIHLTMMQAIKRRHQLDKNLPSISPEECLSAKQLMALPYAATEEKLQLRLAQIRSLQERTTARLSKKHQEKALQRIEKRIALHEQDIASQQKYVLTAFLRASATSFDANTVYFTPSEAIQFMFQVQQRLLGIGVQLRDDLDGFSIVKIIEGSPAIDSDLKEGDRLIAVGQEPVVGLDITEVVDFIRGEAGTTVHLMVLREDKEGCETCLDIAVTRGEVVIQEARISSKTTPFANGDVGIISLHAFYQDQKSSSAGDLAAEIATLKKNNNLKGLILDLRANSGGLLPQAVAVTGLFITKGIVVSIKDNQGHVEHLREIDGKMLYDGPLIVLTSKASASAAEIVAGSLQDYGRAIVVGDAHTYGKGTFQTFTLDQRNMHKVNSKGEFKVTRGRYYTVSGKSPQLTGVIPDITIPSALAACDVGERYAKYPLENDGIAPNFNDDLSDIPPFQREQISWFYRFNLQQCLKTYTRHIPILEQNAKRRLEQAPLHRAFLKEVGKEEPNMAALEIYATQDYQLDEAINVMKDLITLCA